MSAITTHVLDTARGRPAAGVAVLLEVADGSEWRSLAAGRTDDDGRVGDLLSPDASLEAGTYRLTFGLAEYFDGLQVESFYPRASIEFSVRDASEHFHVPLLLSPFGYSTYRGS